MPMDDAARQAHALAMLRDPTWQNRVAATIPTHSATDAAPLAVIAGEERVRAARRVGVLAGSFNPPTLAHVALADSALTYGALDLIVWSISRVTVDKEAVTRASLDARLIALAALTEARDHDAAALIMGGLYADQAHALRATLPQLTDLAFIMGYDKIAQIFDPRYYTDRDAALDTLFTRARVLVAPRGDDDAAQVTALTQAPANQRWGDRVQTLPLDARWRQLSSTEVRARIDHAQSINDLVPPEGLALVAAGAYAAEQPGEAGGFNHPLP